MMYGFAVYLLVHVWVTPHTPHFHAQSVANFESRQACESAIARMTQDSVRGSGKGPNYRCWALI